MNTRFFLVALAVCLLATASAHGSGMPLSKELEDEALAQVSGQDGLAFNLRGFAMGGPLTLTYEVAPEKWSS